MLIYGSWDEQNTLDDMYLLTMPAFRWIKINVSSTKPSNYNISADGMDHFRSSYNSRQMLVVGGRNTLEFNNF